MPRAKTRAVTASPAEDFEEPEYELEEPEIEYRPKRIDKRRALLIGINKYEDRYLSTLRYAVSDVRALSQALADCRYDDIEVLHDECEAPRKPTYENVRGALERIVGRAGRDDLLLVYFAGHGKMREDQAGLFLADSRWDAARDWFSKVLSVEELKRLMTQGESRCLVLMIDACQTGGEGGREVVDPNDHEHFMTRAYEEARGVAVLASCSPGQKAQEFEELGHGLFTYHLLEGLANKRLVDETTQLLTVSRLANHVATSVTDWWERKGFYIQMPSFELKGLDFAIADRSQARRIQKPTRGVFPQLREALSVEGHTARIRHIAVSPEGSHLLTASEDGTARLWNARTGAPSGKPYVHPRSVGVADLSPDGRFLATVCDDGTARLWKAGEPSPTRKFRLRDERVYHSLAFAPEGRHLVLTTDYESSVWSLEQRRWSSPFPGHECSVVAVAFAREGTLMATGGYDGGVVLWNFTAQEAVGSYPRDESELLGPLSRVALSPDGKLLAAAGNAWAELENPGEVSSDFTSVVHVWSVVTGRLASTLRKHTGEVTAIAFSPDGQYLLTASKDCTARLWNASSGRLLRRVDEPRVGVTAAAFSADGRSIILGYEDGSIRVFSPQVRRSSRRASKPSKASSRPTRGPGGR